MSTKRFFVLAWLTSALAYAAPGSALDGFESICTLDESCAVEKSTLVAFRSPSLITYQTISGSFVCSPATFNLVRDTTQAFEEAQCYAMTPAAGDVGSSSSSGASLQTQEIAPQTGLFAVVALSSGKALAVNEGADKEAQLVQQNFRQRMDQVWQVEALGNGYFAITEPGTSLALEIKDWDIRDGAKLSRTPWINSWNQHWQLVPAGDGAYSIRSRFSGHALDVYRMNDTHNSEVVLWTYWGGENQHWRLIPIDMPQTTPAPAQ